MELNIFNIQHFCNGDGPGIRTTVFFGSCPLRCPWCHNPECFQNAETRTMEEVEEEVLHDLEFYQRSEGGVTVSGGEPLARANECFAVLEMLKRHGIHTAVDTSLAVKGLDYDRLVALGDLFLVDIKTADAEAFREVCGGELETVATNLKELAARGANVVLRVPLIPGFNMDHASLAGIANWIKEYDFPVTLLPFHRLGSAKYERLGLEYAYAKVVPSDDATVEAIRKSFANAGIREAQI